MTADIGKQLVKASPPKKSPAVNDLNVSEDADSTATGKTPLSTTKSIFSHALMLVILSPSVQILVFDN